MVNSDTLDIALDENGVAVTGSTGRFALAAIEQKCSENDLIRIAAVASSIVAKSKPSILAVE